MTRFECLRDTSFQLLGCLVFTLLVLGVACSCGDVTEGAEQPDASDMGDVHHQQDGTSEQGCSEDTLLALPLSDNASLWGFGATAPSVWTQVNSFTFCITTMSRMN